MMMLQHNHIPVAAIPLTRLSMVEWETWREQWKEKRTRPVSMDISCTTLVLPILWKYAKTQPFGGVHIKILCNGLLHESESEWKHTRVKCHTIFHKYTQLDKKNNKRSVQDRKWEGKVVDEREKKKAPWRTQTHILDFVSPACYHLSLSVRLLWPVNSL